MNEKFPRTNYEYFAFVSSSEHGLIYLEIKAHVLPIAHVVAVFLEHAKAHPAHCWYRPATKKSKIQNADCLSLAERIEHPIGHVKVQLPGPVSFFLLFLKIAGLLQAVSQTDIELMASFLQRKHYLQNVLRNTNLSFNSRYST